MPYIAVDANRYLGEHTCGNYHYGNMGLRRACCIADAKRLKGLTLANAITSSHPAAQLFEAAWSALTDVERAEVGDLRAVYDHGPAGFEEVEFRPAI